MDHIQSTANLSYKLKKFASELNEYTGSCDNIISSISSKLPVLEGQVDDNILEVRELLKFLFTSDDQTISYGVKHELNQFQDYINEFLVILQDTNTIDNEIFENLKKTVGVSNSTINKIHDISEISENLRVFAINSIVFSQREGDAGRGYQIIANEFIRLSEEISSSTYRINEKGQQMQVQTKEFLRLIEEYEEFISSHISRVSGESRTLLQKSTLSAENFSKLMNDLLSRLDDIKKPTSRIMVDVQLQDIIQQQFTGLTRTLDDALTIVNRIKDHNNPESTVQVYSLLDYIFSNTNSQLRKVNNQMLDLIHQLESHFINIQNILKDFQNDKEEINSLVIPENGDTSRGSIVFEIFSSPDKAIENILHDLKHGQTLKQEVISHFSRIFSLVNDEKNMAMTFSPIIESVNNLLLLGKIEQARHGLALSGNDISVFSQIKTSELSGIIEDVNESHSMIEESLEKINLAFTYQKSKYRGIEDRLRESRQILQKTETIFRDNYFTVINVSDMLMKEIHSFVKLFDELKRLHSKMAKSIEISDELAHGVNNILNEHGGAISIDECRFDDSFIQEVYERYKNDLSRNSQEENAGTTNEDSDGIVLF